MSNSRSFRRIKRNMQVLLGRFHAEAAEGGVGGYLATVQHDNDCPGLLNESMLLCECNPQIDIQRWQKDSD